MAAVITDHGLVLSCRRRANRPNGGQWEFPGGKVEAGELPESALVREIREELGVDVSVGKLLHRDTTTVDQLNIDLSTYVATVWGDLPEGSTDHDLLRWLAASELKTLFWSAPDRAVVDLLSHTPLSN